MVVGGMIRSLRVKLKEMTSVSFRPFIMISKDREGIESYFGILTEELLLHPGFRNKIFWGVDDSALWAGKVGNSWRTTDDINDSWARVMLVGWGGNNGSTLTGKVIANREGISWATKDKVQQANYFGLLTQA